MSACQRCKQPIWWAITRTGQRIPVDQAPTEDGNLVIADRSPAGAVVEVLNRVLSAEPMLPGLEFAIDDDRPRYLPHAATCTPAHHVDKGRLQLVKGGKR